MAATLIIKVEPAEAAAIATIQVDGTKVANHRVELPAPARVHVSVTAMGFRRQAQDVDVADNTELVVKLAKLPSHHSRTLAVTLGMGAVSVIAWLLRRGR